MAILVPPGDASLARALETPRGPEDIAAALGVERVEPWPSAFCLDTVVGPGGKRYRFDIWVAAGARREKQLAVNLCATQAAHPLNAVRGNLVYGPALLVPLQRSQRLTLIDWAEICGGVQATGDAATDALVDRNARGQSALQRRCL